MVDKFSGLAPSLSVQLILSQRAVQTCTHKAHEWKTLHDGHMTNKWYGSLTKPISLLPIGLSLVPTPLCLLLHPFKHSYLFCPSWSSPDYFSGFSSQLRRASSRMNRLLSADGKQVPLPWAPWDSAYPLPPSCSCEFPLLPRYNLCCMRAGVLAVFQHYSSGA